MLSFIKFDNSNREISFYLIVNNFLHNAVIFVNVLYILAFWIPVLKLISEFEFCGFNLTHFFTFTFVVKFCV